MKLEPHICWVQGCTTTIEEPQYCCSGRDCGCMGMPIHPALCNVCFDIIEPYVDKSLERQALLESGKLENVVVIVGEE